MEVVWKLTLSILIGLLLVVLLLRMFEEGLVFFPEPFTTEWNPARHTARVESVYFTTRDNVRLHAWWAPADGATKTFLYFHGNAGNLTHRIENISFLQQLPVNVLAVDYRGYGKSEGRPTEAGVYRDAEAAYDYLSKERGILSAEIVVLGQSMGSAVAVDLTRKRPAAALILESGFPSAHRVAQEAFPLLGVAYIIRSKFDSAAKLKRIHVPVLVAHCRQDPVIPYALGEELYAAANEPKMFVAYPGGCHEPLFIADAVDYASKLRTFLKSIP